MALLSRKKQFALQVEASKGTMETDIAAADADIYAEDVRFTYSPEEVVRNPLRSTLSTIESIAGAAIAQATCRMELKGSGTATTPPSWGKALTCCGFNETVNTSNVTYTPDSDDADTDTGTIWVYQDGVCYKMYGARGTVDFEFTANQVCYGNFTFSGIFSDIIDLAMLSPTYESTKPVAWKNGSIAFNIGGSWTGAVLSTLTVNMNNDVTLRQNANAATGLSYAIITARDPGGTIDPDKVTVATQDWTSHLNTPTSGTFSWQVGSAAGNTLSFSCPKFQLVGMDDGDREGVATDDLTFKLRGSSGEDEITITHS